MLIEDGNCDGLFFVFVFMLSLFYREAIQLGDRTVTFVFGNYNVNEALYVSVENSENHFNILLFPFYPLWSLGTGF